VLTRTLRACLRWRNATAHHPGTPGVMTALRRDRAASAANPGTAGAGPGRKP